MWRRSVPSACLPVPSDEWRDLGFAMITPREMELFTLESDQRHRPEGPGSLWQERTRLHGSSRRRRSCTSKDRHLSKFRPETFFRVLAEPRCWRRPYCVCVCVRVVKAEGQGIGSSTEAKIPDYNYLLPIGASPLSFWQCMLATHS